jgi:hypothetical protein
MPIPLFVGIISMFIGSTLPEDIALSLRRLLLKGHDVLGMVPGIPFTPSATGGGLRPLLHQ